MKTLLFIAILLVSASLFSNAGAQTDPRYAAPDMGWFNPFDPRYFACTPGSMNGGTEHTVYPVTLVGFVVKEAEYCKWNRGKIVFYQRGIFVRAVQAVDGYVIYEFTVGREAISRMPFAVAENPSGPVGDGSVLPDGRYHVVDVLAFTKGNGFKTEIPLLELMPEVMQK